MYTYVPNTRTINFSTIDELSLAFSDVYRESINAPIYITSPNLFQGVGEIYGQIGPENVEPITPPAYKYADDGVLYTECEGIPRFKICQIPGICYLLNNTLILNRDWDWPTRLTSAVWGRNFISMRPPTNVAEQMPRTYRISQVRGLDPAIKEYVTTVPIILPQNPREPIDFEKNIKELFGDKMSNIIMKRMK